MIRAITIIAFLLWLLIYWEGGRRAIADIRHTTSGLDAGLMLTIAGGTVVIVVGGLLILLGQVEIPAGLVTSLPGLLLTATGIGGTLYARHYLGRFWTAEAVVQEEHRVVDTGPYALVRHPIYAAAVLLYLGLGLALNAWWSWIAVVLVIAAYAWKTRLEDRLLGSELPGYKAYCGKTRYMLIPGIW